VGADEIPDAILGTGLQPEAFFKAAVGFVSGNDQILFNGRACYLPIRSLLFVHGSDIGNYESCPQHGFLNGIPDSVAGIVEYHGHPAAGFEHSVVFREATLHQVLIFRQALFLGLVHNSFGRGIGAHPMPGLHKEVKVSIVNVLAEGRIGEDVIDSGVGDVEFGGGAGGKRHTIRTSVSLSKSLLYQPIYSVLEVVCR